MLFKNTIFFILLLAFLPQEEVKYAWSEKKKLRWEDFQGVPDNNLPFVASTQSGLYFTYSIRTEGNKTTLETEVVAYFFPEGSWFKRGKVNPHILQHEQGHFDITEIHARKFRKALEQYRPGKNIKEDLQKIYQRIETERDQMQKAYDRETNHSKNVEKEKQWQQKIAVELSKLKRWK
jgi:hypothetical protein